MRIQRSMIILLALSWLGGATLAADLTDVEEIVRQANRVAFYAADDGRAEARMTIVDGQGRKQVRQFTILRKDAVDGGDQSFLVQFSYPSDIRNTVFLVHKHVGGDDDRWLYLPSLDLVKRIAAGDKRTSFVGSHFFYEDVSGRGLAEDEHTLTETTEKHYVVRNVPRDPQSVEFTEFTVWIDKSDMMPVRTEYKNAAGEIYRRIEALAVETVDGHPTAMKIKATDLGRDASTVTELRYIKYDNGIPDSTFTERALRNPPRKWLER